MQPADLTIVIPTYNEKANIEELIARISRTLGDNRWEVVFVDDESPDGTADLIFSLAAANPRIRCVRRVGRRGLSSACIEGMASSSARYFAVMDADLQHDETLLPAMYAELCTGNHDLVIGSRYIAAGGTGDWNRKRLLISRFATICAQRLIKCNVTDPMSGFFMLRREVFNSTVHGLSGLGFKILLDILATSPTPLRVLELPYQFRDRHAGESKLDSTVALEYGFLLADKMFGRFLPISFILFGMIGASGVLMHFAVLTILLKIFGESFVLSQSTATAVAMVYNFFLNNIITYRDRKLKGSRILVGFVLFTVVCSIGAITNVNVANYLFKLGTPWWMSAAIGIVIVSVWNYAVTAQFVWRSKTPAKLAAKN